MYQSAIVLDDHYLFASALAALIKQTNRFEDVFFSDKLSDVKELMATHKISHLFTDYVMPDVNTLPEIMAFKAAHPGLFIIVVSSIKNANLVFQMHKAGADAFISKNSDKQELEECLSIIDSGKYFVSRSLRGSMVNLFAEGKEGLFTVREHEILLYIAAGSTIEQTAEKLFLSKHTVVAHRRNMMAKMEVNSVAALLKKAMEMGLIQ